MFKHYTKVYGEEEERLHTFLTWALPSPLMAQQHLLVQGLLIIKASRSHSDTPQSVRFLWTNDQPDAKNLCLITHNTKKRQTSMPPTGFNLLVSEFYISILAYPLCKMLITQEPKKVALRNKRHFEEKNGECAACLKYSVLTFVEKNI
jgi:hypothetical protein